MIKIWMRSPAQSLHGAGLGGDWLFPPKKLSEADISAKRLQRKKTLFRVSFFFGAVTRIRTGDLILTKDALYLLSYNSKLYAPYERGIFGDREGT